MLAKLNILKHVVKINLAEDKCLLEPYVLNGTCTVLMRGQGSNSLSLSDQDKKKTFALKLENMLIEKSPVAIQCIDDVFENIMKDESIEKIDVIVRYLDNTVTITLTYGGKLINPITEKDIGLIGEIDGDLEYSPILGYNRAYINVKV